MVGTVETPPLRVVARLMSNIEKRDDGCWISLYSVGSHGYSQIGWNTNGARRKYPRRVAAQSSR